MLRLSRGQIGSTLKSEVPPSCGLHGETPPGIPRRTYHHPHQFARHGMSIEVFRLRKRRHKKYFRHGSSPVRTGSETKLKPTLGHRSSDSPQIRISGSLE